MLNESGSPNTVAASSNDVPCFTIFCLALFSYHSNRRLIQQAVYTTYRRRPCRATPSIASRFFFFFKQKTAYEIKPSGFRAKRGRRSNFWKRNLPLLAATRTSAVIRRAPYDLVWTANKETRVP